MKKLFTIVLVIFLFSGALPQQKTLLIRCDDMGMCHAVNVAFEEAFMLGLPISASVMFACPWYQEAVEIIKKYDNVAVGVHLTLNSEWRNYKWGPVTGREAVPSLVDSNGYFLPSRDLFFKNNPATEEVAKELRAQVERAVNSGITIDYLDYHMGTAMDRPEYRDIVESLAKEFNLGISRYFSEFYTNGMYNDPPDQKEDSLFYILNNELKDSVVNLLVCHIGKDDPELQAMRDLNIFGLKEMSLHRQAELNSLKSERIQNLLKSGKYKLINYADLKKKEKVRPGEFTY